MPWGRGPPNSGRSTPSIPELDTDVNAREGVKKPGFWEKPGFWGTLAFPP